MHSIRIGHLEQAFTQELRRSMGNLTITFHFAETKSTIAGPSLHRLADQNLDGTTSSRMDLVVHHMLETLIVGRTEEDLGVDFASSVSVVHYLVATQMVAILLQESRDFLHVDRIVKRSGITDFALVRSQFA